MNPSPETPSRPEPVAAHIRHAHTRYDELLMKMGDRAAAREAVRGKVEDILESWRKA